METLEEVTKKVCNYFGCWNEDFSYSVTRLYYRELTADEIIDALKGVWREGYDVGWNEGYNDRTD